MQFKTALCYPLSQAVTVMPPLGIGYLAAVTQKAGISVDVYDLSRRNIRPKALYKIMAEKRYPVIGVSVSTPNYGEAMDLVENLRKCSPGSTIVIGGPHPSAFVERTLREFQADYLLQKECELIYPTFLRYLEDGKDPVGEIPGVYRMQDGQAVGLPAQDFIKDLDAIPWPAWDKMPPDKYPPIPHQLFVRDLPVAPIMTTRGCPMGCSFCSSSYLFGKIIRKRSPENVVDEIQYLQEKYGVREFHIEDDNFTFDRSHAEDVLNLILKRRIKVWLKAPNGLMTSTLDPEIINLLYKAGCYQISLGIETTVSDLMDKEKKLLPLEEVRKVVAQARKIGMETQGLFVAGLPYDSVKGFKATVRDAIDMKLDLAHFGVFIPLPGTDNESLLAGCDIKALNFFTPFISYEHISTKEIKSLQRWAILKFYLRPRPIWKLLTMFKLKQLWGVLNAFRKYVIGG